MSHPPSNSSASGAIPSRRLTPTTLLAQTLEDATRPGPRAAPPSTLPPRPPPPPPLPPGPSTGPMAGSQELQGGNLSSHYNEPGPSKKAAPSRPKQDDQLDQDALLDDEDEPGKKKRKRVERACFGCRQRRSKCDGGQPCSICVNNKASCEYPPPPRRVSIKYVEELEAKVANLESRQSSNPSHDSPFDPSDSPAQHGSQTASHRQHSQSSGSSSRNDMGPPSLPYPSHQPFPYPQHSQQQHQQPYPLQPYPSSSHPHHQPYPSQNQPYYNPSEQHQQTSERPPMARSQYSNPYFATVTPPQPDSSHPPNQPYASSSTADYPTVYPPKVEPGSSRLGPLGSQAVGLSVTVEANVSAGLGDGSVERAREFSPGESSEDDSPGEQLAEMSVRSNHPIVDTKLRWERHGQDGISTEVVENAAARLSGQQVAKASRYPPGKPTDDFITQALAIPHDVEPSGGVSETHVTSTIGDTAVKTQTANVGHLQQRVFAKYDLPERDVADSMLAFYHEKVHHLYPIVHWPSLLDAYSKIWDWPPESDLRASDHIFLATLNLLFCITCALRSRKDDGASGVVYFRRSQALMSVPHILLMGNVKVIDYLLLLCQYSQSCSKGNLSANAVGLAILMARGLQLHVQSVNETFGPLERAVRSRAWAACLQMEATSSAMLYRQTTSTDIDFDPSGFPQPYDDDDLRENSVVAREHDKPKSITFFIETVKLFAIKCRILRSLYDLQQPKNFPHAHDVLVLEEQLLLWWKEVPDYLREPTKAPIDGPWKMQAHVLLNRYINCRILLYRPFLFFFCTTPGGSYPIPDSLKFNLARKSAVVCAEAAMELIERVSSSWKGLMMGWWWMSLGQIYSSCLVLLANRIVDRAHPEKRSDEALVAATRSLRSAYDVLIELGWDAANGVTASDDPTDVRYPPASVQSTARRCYRILHGIDRAIKNPKVVRDTAEEEATAEGASAQDRRSSAAKSDESGKTARTAGGSAVPPSRYSRKPDPTIPPLRLNGTGSSNAFDDDTFVASWVGLMQPSFRDESVVPAGFEPPATPFDLATRTLNHPGMAHAADQQHQNTSAQSEAHQWQNWASLLGTGYLSNFGAGDSLALQEGQIQGDNLHPDSDFAMHPDARQAMYHAQPEGMMMMDGSMGGNGFGGYGQQRSEEGVGGPQGRGGHGGGGGGGGGGGY